MCREVQMTERNCVWLVLVLLSIYLFISMVVMVKVLRSLVKRNRIITTIKGIVNDNDRTMGIL